jgi:hypothetical protein
VKILFDASTPAPLAWFLRGLEVVRADELGWQGLGNGALLDAAEQAGFDLLLTCDQNVRRIAARIATAVDFVQTGQIVTVDVTTL